MAKCSHSHALLQGQGLGERSRATGEKSSRWRPRGESVHAIEGALGGQQEASFSLGFATCPLSGFSSWIKKKNFHQHLGIQCMVYNRYSIKCLEKAIAPHSSTLAWKIPWMEETGRLRSMGSLRVRHNWATSLSLFTFMHWRRKWQPTPVFWPGHSQGWGNLVGCRLWGGRTESDTTEAT